MKIIFETNELTSIIDEIVSNAKETLVIVSPYTKVHPSLRLKIEDAIQRVQNFILIYRELKDHSTIQWLKGLENIKIIQIPNLHSKLFFNEDQLLITSMNLYDYSQINNHEIGTFFENSHDVFESEIQSYIFRLLRLVDKHKEHEWLLKDSNEYEMRHIADYIAKQLNHSTNNGRCTDFFYPQLCAPIINKFDFDTEELYNDKSAIYRSAKLGKNRFEKIMIFAKSHFISDQK